MSSYISPGFQSTDIMTLLDALCMKCNFLYLFLCNSPKGALEQRFSSFFSHVPLPQYKTCTHTNVLQILMPILRILSSRMFNCLASVESPNLPTSKTALLWKPQVL